MKYRFNTINLRKSFYQPAFLMFASFLAIAPVPEAQAQLDFPVTYIRCPRTDSVLVSGNIMVNGSVQHREKAVRHVDLFDALPEVTKFFGRFSGRCDLMLREPNGTERVLYDCSSTSTEDSACSAMDPAVSFDGKKIAFSVFRGKLLKENKYRFKAGDIADDADNPGADLPQSTLPNQIISTEEAQIHIVDIASGEVTPLPYVPGFVDSGPAWLSTGRIAFTSNRSKVYRTKIMGTSTGGTGNQYGNASQIYTMDIDGRNVEVASYHGLAGEQHPFQLKDGRVAFASWQLFGALPFRYTNGCPGCFTTLQNLFHIYTQNPDGSNVFALYGQHLGKDTDPTHNTTHFLAQSSDERVWIVDYYRGNNFGLGSIVGIGIPQEGQEGFGPDDGVGFDRLYQPRDFTELAAWSSNSDQFASKMNSPEYRHPEYADPLYYAGKLGHPAGAPNNSLLVTWGKGGCSTNTSDPIRKMIDLGLDNPGCDTGIYFFPSIPATTSSHPADMVMVTDSRLWHEIMPRPVVPYQAVYGQAKPKVIDVPHKRSAPHPLLPAGSPFGILSASSMLFRETHPIKGISFEGELQWGLQGTDTIDYSDNEICGLRILNVQPNDSNEELFTKASERLAILGEIPVRNFQENGDPVFDALGMHDTSFRVRFPANMPYLMQAIDCKGRTLNSDQTWQHLRPMEQKTCGGCHVHGKEGLDFASTAASQADYPVYTLGEGTVPLLAGSSDGGKDVQIRNVPGYGLQIEFERDIMPIFAKRCNQCHSGSSAAAGLRLDQPGTQQGSTWQCLANDGGQSCVPSSLRHNGTEGTSLRRPQVSKYVRFMNSRGSLLYWKAANKRTDNRTDELYGPGDGDFHDVDFGANHPTTITEDELGILSRWIDIGAPAGANMLEDTTAPTLSIMAETNGSTVTALLLGTADAPSGIDTTSLTICVVNTGICGPNLASTAHPSGITKVALATPLADPETVVRASVRDLAGNITKTEITTDRLLNVLSADINLPVVSLPDQIDNSTTVSEEGVATGSVSQINLASATPVDNVRNKNNTANSNGLAMSSRNTASILVDSNAVQEEYNTETAESDKSDTFSEVPYDLDQNNQIRAEQKPFKPSAELAKNAPAEDYKDSHAKNSTVSNKSVDTLAYLTYDNASIIGSNKLSGISEQSSYSTRETENFVSAKTSTSQSSAAVSSSSKTDVKKVEPTKTTWSSIMDYFNAKLQWWKNKLRALFG